MTLNYSNGGASFYNVEVANDDGTELVAQSTTGLLAAFAPVNGALTDKTGDLLTTTLDCQTGRNLVVALTDGDASITFCEIYIVSTDGQKRVVNETIAIAGGSGSGNYAGVKIHKGFTTVKYHIDGAGGGDLVSLGWGKIVGLPYDIGNVNDIRVARRDSTLAVGTFSVTNQSWDLTTDAPDAVKRYFLSGQSTA